MPWNKLSPTYQYKVNCMLLCVCLCVCVCGKSSRIKLKGEMTRQVKVKVLWEGKGGGVEPEVSEEVNGTLSV